MDEQTGEVPGEATSPDLSSALAENDVRHVVATSGIRDDERDVAALDREGLVRVCEGGPVGVVGAVEVHMARRVLGAHERCDGRVRTDRGTTAGGVEERVVRVDIEHAIVDRDAEARGSTLHVSPARELEDRTAQRLPLRLGLEDATKLAGIVDDRAVIRARDRDDAGSECLQLHSPAGKRRLHGGIRDGPLTRKEGQRKKEKEALHGQVLPGRG